MHSPNNNNTCLAAKTTTTSATTRPPNLKKLAQPILADQESSVQLFQAAFLRAGPSYGGGRFIPFVNFPQKRTLNSLSSTLRKDDSPWEVSAFSASGDDGLPWPPRSYSCSFCGKEFCTAQALGGHMNVHRRQRAILRAAASVNAASSSSSPSSNTPPVASDPNINSSANHGLPPAMSYCFLNPAPPAANYHHNPSIVPLQTEIDNTKPTFLELPRSTSLRLAPYNQSADSCCKGAGEKSDHLRAFKRVKLDAVEPLRDRNKGLAIAAPREMCKKKVDLELRLGPILELPSSELRYLST